MLEFYGLKEQPFGVTPDPRYFYASVAHREALASLLCGIDYQVGFAALLADPGMGKTTLLFDLLEKYGSSAHTAFIFNTQCTTHDLLRQIVQELQIETDEHDLIRMHNDFRLFLVNESKLRPALIIIDEAQNLDDTVLEGVRLLSDFETPDRKMLHIILAGQPQLGIRLGQPHLMQLFQRITVVSRLGGLSPDDTSDYIRHRLAVGGYTGPQLFSDDALTTIARCTNGVPRSINRICFNALLLGCALGKKVVDHEIIDEVIRDLDLGRARNSGAEVVPLPSTYCGGAKWSRAVACSNVVRPATATPIAGARLLWPTTVTTAKPTSFPVLNSREPGSNARRFESPTTAMPVVDGQVGSPAKARLSKLTPAGAQQHRVWRRMPTKPSAFLHDVPRSPTRSQSAASPTITKRVTKRASVAAAVLVTAAVLVLLGGLLILKWQPRWLITPHAVAQSGMRHTATPVPQVIAGAEPTRKTDTGISNVVKTGAAGSNIARPSPQPISVPDIQPAVPDIQPIIKRPARLYASPTDQIPEPPIVLTRLPNDINMRLLFSSISVEPPTLAVQLRTSQLTEGKVVKIVDPVYPTAAKFARLQGDVLLIARIGKGGEVESVRVVHGNPVLAEAAAAAVNQWRYSPYVLNGEATSVEVRVKIIFRLDPPR